MFTASTDKQCKMWDLNSNQAIQVAQVIVYGKSLLTAVKTVNTTQKTLGMDLQKKKKNWARHDIICKRNP